jgi:hypothetical protein
LSQSPIEQPRGTAQEITNLLDVSVRTLGDTPKAFVDEVYSDCTKHLPDVVARVGEGALIGAGTTLLLKIPKVAPLVAATGLLYAGVKSLDAAGDFVGKATRADTDEQRKATASESAHQLGGSLSALVESAPGMIAGGYGISRAYGAPPLYTRIGDVVEKNVVAPARESYAFRGPGSIKLSPSLVNQEGEFDALSASKLMAERHPWQGVETGSGIDLAKLRASRIVTGKADGIGVIPGSTRGDVVPFHIHGPGAKAGFLPSDVDMASTTGLGMLRQGDLTTFYVGEGRSYAALAKAGNSDSFFPSVKAVVVDSKNSVAQRFTGQWVPGKGPVMDKPVNLDFGKLLETMSKVKASDPWLSLSAIAPKG